MNHPYREAAALVLLLLATRALPAQTLSQTLLQEEPAKLIAEARAKGDVVRGAILFHQGSIACAKCHRPAEEQARIGPDLSRLGSDVSDESIVESILQPSKVVKKEFQTTMVLGVDGRVFSGIVVKQDGEAIVLRDSTNVDRLVTIKRKDIDELMPGSVSIMPAGLVDELKGRQQFLDLLRYVIDVKQRGPEDETAVVSTSAQRDLSPELAGLVLLRQFNCAACHPPSVDDVRLLKTSAPDLRWSAKKLNPTHLARFIADPQLVKPGTVMPQMMSHLDAAARSEAAAAIVEYLVSLDGNAFGEAADEKVDAATVASGFELFHSVGCVACHSPRNKMAVEQPLNDSVPLGELRGKYSVSALVEFLEDPHVARPLGRMPGMQLTHREAVEISSYLLQANRDRSDRNLGTRSQSNAALIQKGKSLFQSLKCGRCHDKIDNSQRVKPEAMVMVDLSPDEGCLSGDAGASWPQFNLTATERSQIRAALKRDSTELTNGQLIDFNLANFNCTACHRRDGLGGVSPQRSVHFQTTNLNLGDQGRIPPSLSGVGAKLKPKWMRDVLVHGRSVRPYMKTRMPQFGEQNVAQLVDLFKSSDRLAETEFAAFKDHKEIRDLGLTLAGNQGLNCVACHTYQYKLSDTMPAVDLTEMAKRLKKDWFYQYMLDPQRFSPNTVMPSFWPNGRAIRKDIAGAPKYQVEALWQYLLDGRQARAPRGVIREPLEIVVDREARMLRRSYPEIGKRGIGVGYPGGVNLAFDAEQLRLALLWKGRFVDPSGVWYGQGHGKVRPMGPTISLPKGPELDERKDPWNVDEGRPPDHRFKGYSLDEERRPTFRYTFGPIDVEDFFSEFHDPQTDRLQVRRRIKMKANEASEPLRFRLLVDDEAKLDREGTDVTGGQLHIRIASGHAAEITDRFAEKQVVVPLTFEAGDVHELVLEYLWD